MVLEAGAVEARIGADIRGLEVGVKAAEAALQQFAGNAQKSLDAAFAGQNVAPAMRKAAADAVDAARRGMDSRLAAARDAFNRGLIDEDGLARRARDAGEEAARELRTSFQNLSRRGVLPPEVAQRLADDFADAARQAGARAGDVAARSFKDRFSGVTQDIGRIGDALSLRVGLPIALAGGFAARSAVQMESLERGMEALAGSSEEAAEQMERLRDIARAPGIDFKEAVAGANRLRAVGVEAELAEEALRQVANAVALSGGGAQELSGVVRQLSQIQSLGRLMGEELNVILENAPALATALQNAFGTTSAEAIREMGLAADDFLRRFAAGAAQLPRVTAGAREDFEEMRAEIGLAAATIGEEMLPALRSLSSLVTGTSQGVQELDRNTARWVVSAGGATLGVIALAKAVGTARLAVAGMATTTAIASGGITIALGAIGAMFLKAHLDAQEAARAFEEAMQKAKEAGAEFDEASLSALGASLHQARMGLQDLEHDIALTQGKINQILEGGLRGGEGRVYVQLKEQLEELGGQAETVRTRIQALEARRADLLDPPDGEILPPLPPIAADVKELAAALRTLEDAASVGLLRSLGVDLQMASEPLRDAALRAAETQAAFEEAREALRTLGADVPAGAREYVKDLGRGARSARAELERLAQEWIETIEAIDNFTPTVARTVPLPPFLGPTLQGVEDQFEISVGRISESFARGLIDRQAMESQLREAARAFNDGLLAYLDTHPVSPKVRAEILAKLKIDALDETADWKEFGDAASIATMGIVNVTDAFGGLSEQTRRALTGVSELARGISALGSGGPLLSLANLPGLVGIAGGAAQLAAGLFAPDEEAKRVTRENTEALRKLRDSFEDRTRGDLLQGLGAIDFVQQGRGVIDQVSRLADRMDILGPLADEFGISLEKNALVGLAQLEEALRLASGKAFEFGNTLEGAQDRRSALDDIFDRTGAEDQLRSAYETLGQFAPELLRQLGGLDLDLSTAAGRAELERVLREAITAYAEGSLDLALLDQFESGQAFVDLLLSLDRPLDELKESLTGASSAASNVPEIFDTELRRRMARVTGVDALGADEAASRIRPAIDAFAVATPAVEGFVEAVEAAWERLGALSTPDFRVPITPEGAARAGGGLHVHLHNPPEGMDVPATVRQVKGALVEEIGRGGSSELLAALSYALGPR